MRPMHVDSVAETIAGADHQESPRFAAFVAAHGDNVLWKTGGPEHLTASCFVFSPDLRQTLLCFHRKGRFWVQFGGHLEPSDGSLASAAVREAREESGIATLELLDPPVITLDRHDLNAGFTCSAHWDVGFVAIVSTDAATTVSDESDEVRWFPIDNLPEDLAPGLSSRLVSLAQQSEARTLPTGP